MKQHPYGPQAPTPHGTTGTGGEGEEPKRTCGHHAVIDSPPASQTHRRANFIYRQAKIRFSCHHSEPQSTAGASTQQDHRGERGGKQKEDAVKLVMCIGGGDHLQAKTSLFVTEQNAREPQVPAPNRTTGGERRGNRKMMQSSLLCALVGVTTCKPSTSKPKHL